MKCMMLTSAVLSISAIHPSPVHTRFIPTFFLVFAQLDDTDKLSGMGRSLLIGELVHRGFDQLFLGKLLQLSYGVARNALIKCLSITGTEQAFIHLWQNSKKIPCIQWGSAVWCNKYGLKTLKHTNWCLIGQEACLTWIWTPFTMFALEKVSAVIVLR